ncbi:MAG: tRNA uridine-5-carboxymethylaminomethyl(34) synthesis GTPase MnmE, partial [Treponema sp.]|nr:tRNA uridine-5-carboxymethylaminomethyl(34) synthesis GTPase MnmE [Treponema sp.]
MPALRVFSNICALRELEICNTVANSPYYGDESPIAALATGPGENALALIRISGPNSVALLSYVFSRPKKLRAAPGNSIVHGWICAPPARPGSEAPLIDEVLVSVYRAPQSYTGEEGADISCHGGTAVVKAIMNVLIAAGFRESLPGEFSFRAFMNGKLDLTRSESVMELVKAKTDTGREHAVGRLSGRLQGEIAALNRQLVEVLAEAELHLDYDDTELAAQGRFADRLPGRERVENILERLQALADTWQRERLYQEGKLAVIAGRPNAGKSSLFNALLGEDRSIVTDIPGTTRDWIEAFIAIGGIPLRLADTAGLRDTASFQDKTGQVERIGIERSRELLDSADLVLYVIDGAQGIHHDDVVFLNAHAGQAADHPASLILLWNKADIAPLYEDAKALAIAGTPLAV